MCLVTDEFEETLNTEDTMENGDNVDDNVDGKEVEVAIIQDHSKDSKEYFILNHFFDLYETNKYI